MQESSSARLLRHPCDLFLLVDRLVPEDGVYKRGLACVRPPHEKQFFLLNEYFFVLRHLLMQELGKSCIVDLVDISVVDTQARCLLNLGGCGST